MSSSSGISLIIPVYDAALYLRQAIDSALNQTCKPRQVIVVDDGSTDDSLEIAHSYGDAVTVVQQHHAGSASARNRGLEEAGEPLVTFLDADDRLAPDKLERQLRALSSRPDAMLCLCRVCDFWSPEIPPIARRTQKLVPKFRPGQPSTWMVRREGFQRIGSFNASPDFRFGEGSELYTRIDCAGLEVVRINEVLVERRLHAANKTTDSKGHLEGIMALMQRRLQLRRESA